MNSIIRALVVALSALLSYSLTAFSASQPVLTGRVVKVIDGDTIDIRLQSGPIRIRFYGVDAPEKSQAHGKEATAALSSLILGKDVQVEPFQQDRYDRLVGIVYLNELNVNKELVRNGHAWAMRRYMRKADAPLCSTEAEARLKRRGLWASSDAIAPWVYRKRTKVRASAGRVPETVESCVAAIGKPYS
jgi:endonuclease YncB( thermonuclease family)